MEVHNTEIQRLELAIPLTLLLSRTSWPVVPVQRKNSSVSARLPERKELALFAAPYIDIDISDALENQLSVLNAY